jgi:hypothetical protein
MSRQAGVARNELQQMAEHVLYEIKMFRKCFERWRALKEDDPDWNSALENALLHFRVLRDFFCSAPNHGDDVVAADYLTQVEWKARQAPILAETKQEIDKRLAHLTRRRWQAIRWKRGEMEEAMETLINSFTESLRLPESSWFAKLETKSLTSFIVGDVSNSTESVTTIKNVI